MSARAFTAVVNPISGGGKATDKWAPLAARISAAGADVRVELTRSREHAIELATAAATEGRIVVAVGGDGLVRDVAGGVVAGHGTMAIVPAGRGNDLARALDLPTDVDGLANLLLTAPARAIDVIDVIDLTKGSPANGSGGAAADEGVGRGVVARGGGTIVPGNVYAGIDSVANRYINSSRWIPGRLLYRLAPIRAIATWRAATYTLTTDGTTRTFKAHSVVIANSGAYGHGLQIVPPAQVDDGLLHVMVVGDGPRTAVVSFMREAKHGGHVNRPEVKIGTARQVTLNADRPLPLCADGDEIGQLPATLRIRSGALSLLMPER